MGVQGIRDNEIKQIAGYEGYFVNRMGQVFSNRPVNGKGSKPGPMRILKPLPCSHGRYLQITVGDGSGIRKKLLVHKAVAEAFIGPCPDGCEVSHKDGNSHNNHVSNLEYCTHLENERMKQQHGTTHEKEKNPMAKLTNEQVEYIRKQLQGAKKGTARKLALQFGVSEAAISNIKHGKVWKVTASEG